MRTAHKKEGKTVEGLVLGTGNPLEEELIAKGVLERTADPETGDYLYLVKSTEAVHGEAAHEGDFVKADPTLGWDKPYPNSPSYFAKACEHLEGDMYIDHGVDVEFWEAGDEMSPAFKALFDSGKIAINEGDPEHTYSAELWGDTLSIPADGVIIIYGIDEETGDVDFNLSRRDAWEESYVETTEPGSLNGQDPNGTDNEELAER